MIVFLFNVYLLILFLLVWFKVVNFNLFWKISPLIVLLVLLIGLFIPMGWGAPSGPVILVRQSVQIVPNVAGEVIEVPVSPNVPPLTLYTCWALISSHMSSYSPGCDHDAFW